MVFRIDANPAHPVHTSCTDQLTCSGGNGQHWIGDRNVIPIAAIKLKDTSACSKIQHAPIILSHVRRSVIDGIIGRAKVRQEIVTLL